MNSIIKQFLIYALIFLLMIYFQSCATLIAGRSQVVSVDIVNTQAEVYHKDLKVGTTPLTFKLKNDELYFIIKEGYKSQRVVADFYKFNPALFGNFLAYMALYIPAIMGNPVTGDIVSDIYIAFYIGTYVVLGGLFMIDYIMANAQRVYERNVRFELTKIPEIDFSTRTITPENFEINLKKGTVIGNNYVNKKQGTPITIENIDINQNEIVKFINTSLKELNINVIEISDKDKDLMSGLKLSADIQGIALDGYILSSFKSGENYYKSHCKLYVNWQILDNEGNILISEINTAESIIYENIRSSYAFKDALENSLYKLLEQRQVREILRSN